MIIGLSYPPLTWPGVDLRAFWLILVTLIFQGCAHERVAPISSAHISAAPIEPVAPPAVNIPPPITVNSFLPPPTPLRNPPTYSIVVNEVPVKEMLFALGRDSKLNIDVHPAIQGVVTLNAVNQTLPEILDRVARQVNMRYKFEGNTIVIMPDTPYFHTYRINYVNMARNTTSSIGVSTQIAATGTSGVTTGTGGASTTSSNQSGANNNNSSTNVTSTSANNFWELLSENIRHILTSTNALSRTTEEKAVRAEAIRTAREERLLQAEAASRAGAGASGLFDRAFGGSQLNTEQKEEVIVNPVAGTILVLATERQQKLIQAYLDGIASSVLRQVLIEATIVEVRLSNTYQSGVDWSRIAQGTGFTFNQSLIGGNLSTPPNLTIGYANPTSALGNIALTMKLLESFGNIKVLSSPKIMALNNQTALLKVVDEKVYFTTQLDIREATVNIPERRTFTTAVHTVPIGVVMSVTPQVADNGRVSLNIRPTISRITGFAVDPGPRLAGSNFDNLIPEVQVREMESVLQIRSGQTVILGGLMQDDINQSRDGIPGLGRLPGAAGDLFSYRDDGSSKTELVIFLRPTIIGNPSLDSEELKIFRRFLPSAEAPSTSFTP